MKVQILRTDGREEEIEIPRSRAIPEIEAAIGASVLDGVSLRDGRVMFVDDNGYDCEFVDHGDGRFESRPVKARKPVNVKATALYHAICVPNTTHQIVGDAAIVRDEDFA